MCEHHLPRPSTLFFLEQEEKVQRHFTEVQRIYTEGFEHFPKLEDFRLIHILETYAETGFMSPGQLNWLRNSLAPFLEAKKLEGDLRGIWVMFQIAGQHLKRPKVRLLSQEGTYFELWFEVSRASGKSSILLFEGGWQGHGRRRRIGSIEGNQIIPWRSESISPDILSTLQEFSLDPARIALASAQKLSACSFCGIRLSDPESKKRGYGPVCADHFALPWGDKDEKTVAKVEKIRGADDLSLLF